MWRICSAIILAAVWWVGLTALMGPGMDTIEDGLASGKRLALAQYAQLHANDQP